MVALLLSMPVEPVSSTRAQLCPIRNLSAFFLGGGEEGVPSFVNYCLKVEYINRLNILKLVRRNFQEFLAQCSRRQMVVIKN